MAKLADVYDELKYSIVAIASRVSTNPEFPDIIGTGFIVHSKGVVFTCGHVIDAMKDLPRKKGAAPGE